MRTLQRIFFRVFLCCLAVLAACGGSGGRQASTDDATHDYALLAQSIVGFFKNNLSSCDNFFTVLNGLSQDPTNCDNPDAGGTFTLTHDSGTCTDAPLNASVNFTMNQTNCFDKNAAVTSEGVLTFNFSTSSKGNIVLVASPAIVTEGLNIDFTDFEVNFHFTNNTLTCSGNMNVDGQNCSINSNCGHCGF